MKKTLTAFFLASLLVFAVGLTGCTGEDEPGTAGDEVEAEWDSNNVETEDGDEAMETEREPEADRAEEKETAEEEDEQAEESADSEDFESDF